MTGRDAVTAPTERDGPPDASTRLVAWEATGRRLRRSAVVLAVAAVVAWLVAGVVDGSWPLRALANWAGLAVLALFVVEVVVVGGSALRGLLRAGERGERLSSGDVGLFPPVRGRSHTADDA